MTAGVSWGRYPRASQQIIPLYWRDAGLPGAAGSLLPFGNGRSYGDVCLNDGGTLLHTRGLDRLIAFDAGSGVLRCESGTLFSEILAFAVPRGWFLPVTPGTQYITVGGAIANDVHGKNHHRAGTFGEHLLAFELLRSDGARLVCSRADNASLFGATIAGLGLTGLITWAQLRLKPIVSRAIDYEGIQFHGINEFLELKQRHKDVEYTVSWVDCVSTGKNFARGIFMLGGHSKVPGELKPSPEPRLVFPFEAPGFALNRTSVSAFNTLFFHKQRKPHVKTIQDYEPFFYPLDAILHWNRMYGRNGLVQFQYSLPWETAVEGTEAILRAIANSGLASFLAVLKTFGDIPSLGMMSFPQPGIMFALDFPIKTGITFPLLERLGDMTLDYGGRLYPAKDAAMTSRQFQTFYPNWERFARFRDPMITSSFWERVTDTTGARPTV